VEQIDHPFFGILLGLLHLIQYKKKKESEQTKEEQGSGSRPLFKAFAPLQSPVGQ